MKKTWKKPQLQILDIGMTEANEGNSGVVDGNQNNYS